MVDILAVMYLEILIGALSLNIDSNTRSFVLKVGFIFEAKQIFARNPSS